jgi:hypothetical protein
MTDRRRWLAKDNDASLDVPPCGGERNVARREPDGASRTNTAKKKPALGRAKSIFLEEDRGDGSDYADALEINPILISDIAHTKYE